MVSQILVRFENIFKEEMMCIFCKIVNREIPVKLIYEDEFVVAFDDINPTAPVHFLVIPKIHISTLNEITSENSNMLAKIFEVIPKLAKEKGVDEKGYRVVANCNSEGGQEVFHIHFHVIGGKQCKWPAV